MNDVVIVAAGRTAVGKFGGALAKFPAADLGAHVIKGLLAKTGLKPEQISEVILGQVLTAGVGQNAARQAATRAAFWPTPAVNTWPRMTSEICSGLSPVFASSPLITCAPRSAAGNFAKAPPNLPTAVRPAATITTSFI